MHTILYPTGHPKIRPATRPFGRVKSLPGKSRTAPARRCFINGRMAGVLFSYRTKPARPMLSVYIYIYIYIYEPLFLFLHHARASQSSATASAAASYSLILLWQSVGANTATTTQSSLVGLFVDLA